MPDGLRLSTLRAVLFDVDGTLVDTQQGVICGLGDASERYFGYRPDDEVIQGLIGRPIQAQLENYAGHEIDPQDLEAMTAYTIERFEHFSFLDKPIDPALEALDLFHRCGFKVALVTSKTESELRHFLSRFPGAESVHATVCSNDVRSPKPDPECALLACERLEVAPHEAVFIGDSVYDIRCAHDAGLPAVAVAYGSAPKEALSAESPEILLETPNALLEWVKASLAQTPCAKRI